MMIASASTPSPPAPAPRSPTARDQHGLPASRVGDALEQRDFLRDLLVRSVTGTKRVRSGVPEDWPRAPNSTPLVIAIMSSKSAADAKYDEALIAEAAAYVADQLT